MATVDVLGWDKKKVGSVELDASVFDIKVKKEILQTVVRWQLACRRRGTHKSKTRAEVSGGGKKPFKQKGTGNARQGNARGVQCRGGGIAFGPVPRSHEIKLQKKVRKLGMRHALSVKFSEGAVHIIDSTKMKEPKTADLVKSLSNFGLGKFFIIDGIVVDQNIKLSAKSAANTCVVPVIGANVYDIVISDYSAKTAFLRLKPHF